MAKRKKYRIYCETEEMQVSGWTNLDEPPNICPNNPAHTVDDISNSTLEILALNNLEATIDPTANDDIDDGYAIGSRWLNTTSEEEFICTDNTATKAV